MFKKLFLLIFFFLAAVAVKAETVELKFFYSEDCQDCRLIENAIFPELEQRFKEQIQIEKLEINNPLNYALLLRYEEQYRDIDNEIPVIFINGKILSGPDEIEENLPGIVKHILKENGDNQVKEPLVYLAYFSQKGCRNCRRFSYDLKYLKGISPNLIVKEFDLDIKDHKELNETLCNSYQVPVRKHLAAPAVFIGNDFLIAEEVTGSKVRSLIKKYQTSGTMVPWEISNDLKKQAQESILTRFQSLSFATVILAGFLDGINPCAFVTIIFFISYLSVIQRKGKEIIFVGAIFSLAVFLTYLLVGLGFLKVVQELTFLPLIAKIVYLLTAVMALVLAFLNFRDYLKCRRGNLKEMTLKLPDSIRKRINHIISRQLRLHHIILASLTIGFLVSILELACTGQVYLPTIIFVTQLSGLEFKAFAYLILYNFMFILPLIIIFILAYSGLTSGKLSGFIQKNVTLIKILTSVFFFSLAGLLMVTICKR